MPNRIIICFQYEFPRKSAMSNYIQYLINALLGAGYECILITRINTEFPDFIQTATGNYKSFKIIPVQISSNKIIGHIELRYMLGIIWNNKIKPLGITRNDIILVYSSDLRLNNKIQKLKSKIGFKTIVPVVEWFERSDFLEKDIKNGSYRRYVKNFTQNLPKYDLILPISNKIAKYFDEIGCKTMVLPILANPTEYQYSEKEYSIPKFIYPANGKIKDFIAETINGFISAVEDQNEQKAEFHFTGVPEKVIVDTLGEERFQKYRKQIIIHKWMKYSELVELYKQMNYLIIVRGISQMTLSNFPSKVPEAMTYGIVPIVSKVGDYTEYYLQDEINSIFIDGCSEEKVKAAIKKAFLLDRDKYHEYSKNARKCVEEKFDFHVWIPQIQRALDDMLKNKSSYREY